LSLSGLGGLGKISDLVILPYYLDALCPWLLFLQTTMVEVDFRNGGDVLGREWG
jgi:hypothetical protein